MIDEKLIKDLNKLIEIVIDDTFSENRLGCYSEFDFHDFSFAFYPDNYFIKPLKFFNEKLKKNEFLPKVKSEEVDNKAIAGLLNSSFSLRNTFEDYIKKQEIFITSTNHIIDNYPVESEKVEEVLLNFFRFITYYIVNLKWELNAWKSRDPDTLKSTIIDMYTDKAEGLREWEEGKSITFYVKALLINIKVSFWDVLDKNINNQPLEYYLNQLIEGIFLDNVEYNLAEGVIIRKLDTIDIQFKDLFYLYKDKPLSILEIKTDSFIQSMCEDEKFNDFKFAKVSKDEFINFLLFVHTNYKINDALHLLSLSSIFYSSDVFYAKSFDKLTFRESKTDKKQNLPENLKYNLSITNNNIETLTAIISKVKIFEYLKREDKNADFIKISLDFYKEALTKDTLNKQITYSVLALEALYNTSPENLSATLRKRISSLLGILNEIDNDFNSETIQSDIRQAYKIRSGYVHAFAPKINTDSQLAKKILNYSRLSILIFMQLLFFDEIEIKRSSLLKQKNNKNKQRAIKKASVKEIINHYFIDWALINKGSYQELQQLVLKCIINI